MTGGLGGKNPSPWGDVCSTETPNWCELLNSVFLILGENVCEQGPNMVSPTCNSNNKQLQKSLTTLVSATTGGGAHKVGAGAHASQALWFFLSPPIKASIPKEAFN